MSEQTEFNVATVADQRFFPGLWAMLVSTAAHVPDLSKMTFHVVDGGIDPGSWKALEAALSKHPRPPHLVQHVLDTQLLEELPLTSGKSPLTYARLLFPKIFNVDQLLYLDADILVFKDVTEIFKNSTTDNAGSAALNADGSKLSFDLDAPTCLRYKKSLDGPYFNAGVLLMNLNYWRKHGLAEKCFDFLANNKPCYVDQTAINVVMNDQLTRLDPNWNRLANRISPEEFTGIDFVVHFTSAKPWLVKQLHPAAALFEKYCQDTGLELKARNRDANPHYQHPAVHHLRSMAYRTLGALYGAAGQRVKATGYADAASYWKTFASERHSRTSSHRAAIERIMKTNYRPDWL